MAPVVERLVGEVLDDGGWNCSAEAGSVRSSFNTTINVVEGLLGYERATGGTPASRTARASGEEYLLQRSLFRRRSTGEVADERFMLLTNPDRWFYHVLRGLEHFRAAGIHDDTGPDPRLGDALEYLESRRRDDGRWVLDWNPEGASWFELDAAAGEPSKWVTLRAMRVLRWAS